MNKSRVRAGDRLYTAIIAHAVVRTSSFYSVTMDLDFVAWLRPFFLPRDLRNAKRGFVTVSCCPFGFFSRHFFYRGHINCVIRGEKLYTSN